MIDEEGCLCINQHSGETSEVYSHPGGDSTLNTGYLCSVLLGKYDFLSTTIRDFSTFKEGNFLKQMWIVHLIDTLSND